MHNKTDYIKHPAIINGVVQKDVKWEKAILYTSGGDGVSLQTKSRIIDISIEQIDNIKSTKQEIGEKTIKVIDVVQFDGKDTYNTFIYSDDHDILIEYLKDKVALYSGIESFKVQSLLDEKK
ncbi:MAG: CheF family chemotaxis protein [Methanosarcinales archaeon]